MISIARSARPRRSKNRVQLVNIDGTPVRRPDRDHALAWPASADNWRWATRDRVIGTDSMGADVHESDCPEPDDDARRDGASLWAEMMIEASLPPVETDAQFLARLDAHDLAERRRIAETYHPTDADLRDYAEWLASLDDNLPPPDIDLSEYRTVAEWDAVRRGQVSETELAMMAAGMAI